MDSRGRLENTALSNTNNHHSLWRRGRRLAITGPTVVTLQTLLSHRHQLLNQDAPSSLTSSTSNTLSINPAKPLGRQVAAGYEHETLLAGRNHGYHQFDDCNHCADCLLDELLLIPPSQLHAGYHTAGHSDVLGILSAPMTDNHCWACFPRGIVNASLYIICSYGKYHQICTVGKMHRKCLLSSVN